MSRTEIMPEALYDSTQNQYVHAIVEDETLYMSGQVARAPSGDVVGDAIELQTRQAFENVEAILDEVDADFADVAKVTSYLTAIHDDYDGYKTVFAEFFDALYPCHTMLGVDALAHPALRVELEVEVPL
jgi:2-iminobutanoate/2-iminopropanoate deaminase